MVVVVVVVVAVVVVVNSLRDSCSSIGGGAGSGPFVALWAR